MKITVRNRCVLAFLSAALLAAGPVLADKPSWAGEGKNHENKQKNKKGKKDQEHASDHDREGREHFGDQHRVIVREYYGEQFRAGKCPPGLAKKNNGCMPPGQAKKWRVGHPLPPDVVYYAVPAPLVVKLGPPPSGYRYIRVAADILMIAIGTGLIVDAIQDLNRM